MNPLRRRRDGACRLPPLPCGHRDPLSHLVRARAASTYSLTTAELLAEGRRLRALGWEPGEIRLVLADPIRAGAR